MDFDRYLGLLIQLLTIVVLFLMCVILNGMR